MYRFSSFCGFCTLDEPHSDKTIADNFSLLASWPLGEHSQYCLLASSDMSKQGI